MHRATHDGKKSNRFLTLVFLVSVTPNLSLERALVEIISLLWFLRWLYSQEGADVETENNMEKVKEVAVLPQEKKEFSIQELMVTAVQNNVPVETMERLVALRTTMRAEAARESFNAAMAKFQADCPAITKTKEVKTRSGVVAYRYAPIESIVAQVKDALMLNGFSYSTNMELLESGVKVSVKVTHREGHSEVSEMSVPLGNKTDIMSASQVVAAAQTFAKRYAFCNAFGILTGDEDTDAAPQKESEYDTSPVSSKAKVTSTGDDTPGIESQKKVNPKTALKNEIKKLCDDKALVPLLGPTDYRRYVKEITDLDMGDDNLPEVLERLKTLL